MTKKILIIDDEPDIRELIQVVIELLTDWQVSIASSGLEGCEKAESEKPDVILLDLMMPVIDGIATFAKLQENPQTCHIPTIFMTAKNPTEGENLIDLGVKGIIFKPFEIKDFIEQIYSLLDG